MKLSTHMAMHSTPDFSMDARVDPVGFLATVAGAVDLGLDRASLHVGEIPVRVAIPFLKRRGKPPLLGTIGGFRIRLDPLHARAGMERVEVQGVLGTQGIGAKVDAGIKCVTEMQVDGDLTGKVGTFSVELDAGEPPAERAPARPRKT